MPIVEILKADSPIKSWQLERRLHISNADVCMLVHDARIEGHPIGSGSNGYFYCNEAEDLDSTIAQIQGRINSLVKIQIALAKTRSRLSGEQGTLKL